MAAAAGNVGNDGDNVIGRMGRDLELPKLEALWPEVWDEFVSLGGLKNTGTGAIVKLLYIRSWDQLTKLPTMSKVERKSKFEEIYKNFAKRFATDYKDEFSQKVAADVRTGGKDGEGLYPIRRHSKNANKTPDWCQAAADSRKEYSKFAINHMANLRSALEESGTNNAGDLLRLLNVNIYISEREEKRLTTANKRADAAVNGGGDGEDSEDSEDDDEEAPAPPRRRPRRGGRGRSPCRARPREEAATQTRG